MSLQKVLSEEIFYRSVKVKCSKMIDILPMNRRDSVFVNSIQMFWRNYELQHNTRDDFIAHCQLLENARAGYIRNELTDDEESKIMYDTGHAQRVFVCGVLEDVCAYIEKYLEKKIFGVWWYTPKETLSKAPEFPAERQSMKNLTTSLREYAKVTTNEERKQAVLHGIEHLETNFQYIIDKLNNVPDVEEEATEQQGPMHAAGGSFHDPMQAQAHWEPVDSLLQSLARLSESV